MILHDQVSNDNGLGIRRRPSRDGNVLELLASQ